MQILQQLHQVTILYDENHQFRQVRLNESHPPNVKPSWHGDSVGHYEGDALTIDTVAVKPDRPFAMIGWRSPRDVRDFGEVSQTELTVQQGKGK